MNSSWQEQRRSNAAARARQLAAQEAAESVRAQGFLNRFVEAAVARGLAPEPLRVTDGVRVARTPLVGWYLKADRSAAVDRDGHFYILTAPVGFRERLRGVQPRSSPPPLILGRGGRDGEQIDLVDALDNVLPEWRKADGP